MQLFSKALVALLWITVVCVMLFMTPIGGVVGVIVGGGALIGGGILVFKSLFDLFDPTSKHILAQFVFGLSLIAFAMGVRAVLPPLKSMSDVCIVSRFNDC